MNSLIKNIEQSTVFNRGQSAKIFRNIVESGETVLVTQNNSALVVIMSAEKYVDLTGSEITVQLPHIKSTEISTIKVGEDK